MPPTATGDSWGRLEGVCLLLPAVPCSGEVGKRKRDSKRERETCLLHRAFNLPKRLPGSLSSTVVFWQELFYCLWAVVCLEVSALSVYQVERGSGAGGR